MVLNTLNMPVCGLTRTEMHYSVDLLFELGLYMKIFGTNLFQGQDLL
jgi:hypothetical protein